MGNLTPSCTRSVPGEQQPATAYPPRRIVELAQMFGPNGMVQSICQDDFGPAVDMLVNTMSKPLGEMCLPQHLIRDDEGLVSCKLYWELPTPDHAKPGIPTTCDELGGLVEPDTETMTSADGGARCEIHQVAVMDAAPAQGVEGWYYDDFTENLEEECAIGLSRRIAFTEEAHAPSGAAVKLDCAAGAAEVKD